MVKILRILVRKYIVKTFDKKEEFCKKLKNDVPYFPEEICDLILYLEPKTIDLLLSLINAHLDLETRAFGRKKEIYKIGEAKKVFGDGSKIK